MTEYPKFIIDLIDEYSKNRIIEFEDPLVINRVEHRFIIGYNLILEAQQEKKLIVIMMNPSKANQNESDPTINRLLNYANRHNYSKLIVLNSLPVHLTKSSELQNEMISKKQYSDNIKTIRNTVSEEYEIVLATGDPVIRKGAESIAKIYEILQNMKVKRFDTDLTKMGYTKHLRVVSNEEMERDLVEMII